MAMAVALLLILYALLIQQLPPGDTAYPVPYSEFKSMVADGQVRDVVFRDGEITGTLFDPAPIGPERQESTRFTTRVPVIGDDTLMDVLERARVTISAEVPAEAGPLARALLGIVPWLIFLGVFLWLMTRVSRNLGGRLGGPDEIRKFLETTGREAKIPEVTFDDVAGQQNAKREVTELVDSLKDPEKYHRLGAEMPRGVLLMGSPGTGKTLLAKALAGEAGVPFFSISGSEFIEVFVGVGASRVRNLFAAAKKNAPSIIFIDELDSIGRTRGTGLGGGHDEREQTLNQILAEMDGFSGHEAVVVLAATNRPDVLDPALMRPGRFDRHVMLDLPDINDREAILKVHLRKVPVAPDIDIAEIAAGTPGFSGADLRNLINEAAIHAARDDSDKVEMRHFDEARDKVMMGTERTLAIQPEERHRLAVHEAGHTLVAYYLPHADPLYKVSIVPRGRALGATQQLPEEERHTMPEDYLRERLAVTMGGRCAEKELLGTVSSGADDDIHQATVLARAMVSRWGMSEEVGPVDLRESEEHPFLGREIAQPRRYSEHSAEIVDNAVRKLLLEAEQLATEMINAHRPQMERLIRLLEERETLYREQIDNCLNPDTWKKPIMEIGAGPR
jgi:cell division protease FtsH